MSASTAFGAQAQPKFDCSVFISYSHADNQPFGIDLGHGERNWVSFLDEELGKRLRMLSEQELSVWRDPKLQGNDVFADELTERLASCAVLVSVCTPRYLHSEWCRRELEEFVRASQTTGGLRVGTKSRLFKVVKTPVDRDELPGQLEPLLGYEFYGVETDGSVREFLLMHQPEGLVLFYQRLDDLVGDIAKLLDELEGASTGDAEAVVSSARTIFLGNATSDVVHLRDDLKRELERRGHLVVPETEMPLVAADLSHAIEDQLSEADMAIHVLGARYGLRPEGDERSIPHIQLSLAREAAARRGVVQLIWLPDGLQPIEDSQRDLISELRTWETGEDAEVVLGSLEVFKSYLLDRIAEQAAPPPEMADAVERVFLIHDPVDRAEAIAIRDHLEERGLAVMTPLSEGSEREARQLHEDTLLVSDAVLIYYGKVSEHWVRMKLNDLIKARGWGRDEPFQATGVVLGPPGAPSKSEFHTSDALVLDAIDEGAPAALEPFLGQLARSREAR
jgi:hypothetical protein